MTDYTDLELMTDDTAAELSLMHLNGIPCPDDDRAHALYAALDEVDHLLRTLDDTPPNSQTPGSDRG